MKKLIIFLLISLSLQNTAFADEVEKDPFTVYIQGLLKELGLLETITGVNDYNSMLAIKTFQKNAGLIVDGFVGVETLPKLQLGEDAYISSLTTTTTTTTTLPVSDTQSPEWNEELPPYATEVGSLFNLNIPSVTDNFGVVSYEVYVNGALSNHIKLSETRLLVTPKFDMTCADQLVYVIAYDAAGNSSQSPAFTIPQTDPCTTSNSSSESNTSTFIVTFGGVSYDDFGFGIAVDTSDNVYISGVFRGTVDFGGGDVTSVSDTNDVFVLKLNSSGTFQWVQTYGGSDSDSVYDLAIDSSNNLIVAGIFRGTVDFGSGDVVSSGGIDAFVLKLNSSGTFQWVQTYGGTSSEFAYSVDVDSSDNLYISGEFSNTVDFGGGAETAEAGHCDIFVLKLNSSGTFQWVETLGSFGNDRALHITVDSSGNSYTTGEFTSTTNFGGGNVANNGGFDIFVLKLNSSGTFQWVETYGDTANDRGQNIKLDSSDNPIIVGQFQETIDFGSGNITSSGFIDIFVLKLNSSGTFQWVQTYGGTSGDSGRGVAVDSSDNILISGYFQGTVDFGSGNITSSGDEDAFVLKLNSSGVFQWAKTYGDSSSDRGDNLDLDSSDNLVVTGYFSGTVDFGSGNIISNGGKDVFVLKLRPSGVLE